MAGERKVGGFTLIELLVVMAIIATLLTIAAPRYFSHLARVKEAVLRADLREMRDAVDKFHGDTGKYPAALEELIGRKYLRKIPPDPLTESAATWVIFPPEDREQGGVYDVRSGAVGVGSDGTLYTEW